MPLSPDELLSCTGGGPDCLVDAVRRKLEGEPWITFVAPPGECEATVAALAADGLLSWYLCGGDADALFLYVGSHPITAIIASWTINNKDKTVLGVLIEPSKIATRPISLQVRSP